MPIYEYRCASCGHALESLQKLSDAPLTVCPACHKAELRKQVSAAGFQLKGSGWYVTDFRNSGAKQPAKDGSAKAASNGNGGDAKTSETKAGDGGKTETTPSATSTGSAGAAGESQSSAATSSAKTGT